MTTPGAAETSAALIGLVETCRDGELGFHAAAAGIEEPTLRQLCQSYAEQRAAFREELLIELAELAGGDAAVAASGGRGPSAPPGVTVTLAELARRDAAAESAYRAALGGALFGRATHTVERQHEQVRDALKHLSLLERTLAAVA